MNRRSITLTLLLLASCRPPSSTRTVSGPSGPGWLSIECAGTQQNCIDAAAAACPSGYQLADSGGRSDVIGSRNQVGSVYTGHMLVKCNKDEWRTVTVEDCTFKVPGDWVDDAVDGTTVYHPRASYDKQATLSVTPAKASLLDYAAKEYANCERETVEIHDHSGVFAWRKDELNGVRVATIVAEGDGRFFELTCASAPTSALDPICQRVLSSLRIASR